jgi:hypothetical protein
LAFPGVATTPRPKQAAAPPPPPPNENMKIRLCMSVGIEIVFACRQLHTQQSKIALLFIKENKKQNS